MLASAVTWSGAWDLHDSGGAAWLERRIDGSALALDGAAPPKVREAFERFRVPVSQQMACAIVDALGGHAAETLSVLEDAAVLRRVVSGRPMVITGTGPLAATMRSVASAPGWGAPSLHVFDARHWRQALMVSSKVDVAVTQVGGAVIASSLSAGCPACALLRALGSLGVPGEEQSHLLQTDAAGHRQAPEPAVVELLLALSREPLVQNEALMVLHGEGAQRGIVLPHPDCPSCGSRFGASTGSSLDTFARERPEAVSTRVLRQALVDSPFSPATLERRSRDAKLLPLGVPFLFGDTRLSRVVQNKIWCTSIKGIIHGSAESEEASERLALSEAVERLAAQSISPTTSLPSSDSRAESTQRQYQWWSPSMVPASAAYVHGADLIRESECLVPLGRVAVGCPTKLDPDGAGRAFTGTASHETLFDALLHGTVEIIKRDAFMIAWYRRRRLSRLDWPCSLPPSIAARRHFLESRGIALELFDLTLDIPLPLILIRARSTSACGNWPSGGTVLTPAGGLTRLQALAHGLKLVCGRFVSLAIDPTEDRDPTDTKAVDRMGRDAPFWPLLARYLDPRNSAAVEIPLGADRVFESLPPGPPGAAYEQVQWLREVFRTRSIDWLMVRLTDAVARYSHFEVAKVVMPQFVRLTMARDPQELARPRLRMGIADALMNEPYHEPHPLY